MVNPDTDIRVDTGNHWLSGADFPRARLSEVTGRGVSDKDQAEIRNNMETRVLDSSAYPESVFNLLKFGVSKTTRGEVSVTTFHGAMRSVTFDVTHENDAYVGVVQIKQIEFGIQPIKIGGGVIKVKDGTRNQLSRLHSCAVMDDQP